MKSTWSIFVGFDDDDFDGDEDEDDDEVETDATNRADEGKHMSTYASTPRSNKEAKTATPSSKTKISFGSALLLSDSDEEDVDAEEDEDNYMNEFIKKHMVGISIPGHL